MAFEVQYFHPRVLAEIEAWPVDVVADYARLVEYSSSMGPISDCRTRGPSAKACLNFVRDGKSGIGRAFYCFLVGKRVVIVHAFVKKTQQTPDKELKLARKRAKELLNG